MLYRLQAIVHKLASDRTQDAAAATNFAKVCSRPSAFMKRAPVRSSRGRSLDSCIPPESFQTHGRARRDKLPDGIASTAMWTQREQLQAAAPAFELDSVLTKMRKNRMHANVRVSMGIRFCLGEA